jgi:hypothetical protein
MVFVFITNVKKCPVRDIILVKKIIYEYFCAVGTEYSVPNGTGICIGI